MSDIERAAFEQAVADKWSDSYKFTRFGDEDYYDEVLEGMWWGWQASRQALEGEAVAWWDGDMSAAEDSFSFKLNRCYTIPLYTHPASADDSKHHAVMQAQIWAQEARTQKAIVKEIGEMVGCANDWEMVEAVRDALANVCVSQSAEYETQADLSLMDDKQAASVPEWIKCSDRLPAEYDGDFEGLVWVNDRDMTLPKYAQSRVHWSRVRGIAGYTHWMPTGFRRPQPPKQEGE